jgi:hypothetical protein
VAEPLPPLQCEEAGRQHLLSGHSAQETKNLVARDPNPACDMHQPIFCFFVTVVHATPSVVEVLMMNELIQRFVTQSGARL